MPEAKLYETHMHTPLCKHAVGEPEEYAEVAKERGLAGITVTCHNPMPDGFSAFVRMELDEFDQYLTIIERAKTAYKDVVDVRLGLECDYFPGYEAFVEEQTASAGFDYIIGSVHPQLPEYQRSFYDDDVVAFQKGYFTHLADAAETRLFDCISHPDLVKNCFPKHWNLEIVWDHILLSLDRIAASGTAMELNTSGLHKSISQFNPSPEILSEIHARGIPIVIGADAHQPERVGADFELALETIESAGFTQVSYFLERQRQDLPIEAARNCLIDRSA